MIDFYFSYFSSNLFIADVTKPHGWDAELPLHWAISEQAPLFITEALLDIYPDGITLIVSWDTVWCLNLSALTAIRRLCCEISVDAV